MLRSDLPVVIEFTTARARDGVVWNPLIADLAREYSGRVKFAIALVDAGDCAALKDE